MSRLPAAAILGQAPVGRPGADHAARPGSRRQPVAEVLAEHPLKQPDVVLERWQQHLALLPAKRLPFLATALQEDRYGREGQRSQRVPLSRAGLPRRRQETSAWSCLVVECGDDDRDNQLGQLVIYRISPDLCYETTDQPLVTLARRRTGVKNGRGTARDVVCFLVRLRPRVSLTPGAGS